MATQQMVARRTFLVCMGALTGCIGEVYYECPAGAVGGVLSEVSIDCGAVNQNAALAVSMLADKNIRADWSAVRYTIQAGTLIRGTTNVIGRYDLDPTPSITLAIDGRSLLHEMIHHWQTMRGDLLTIEHHGWCEMGYGPADCAGSLDAIFEGQALPLTRASNDDPPHNHAD